MGERMMKFKNNRKYYTIVLVAIPLILGVVGFAAAKYVANYQKEAEIHASNFHFSSDYLRYAESNGQPAEIAVSNWGQKDVRFHLFNYEVENVALLSETDIAYKIDLSDDEAWTVSVTDSTGNLVNPVDGSYTLLQSDSPSSHLVTLTYTGTEEIPQVTVKVTSTDPYTKTLTAKFTATTKKGIEYSVSDKGNYTELTISTNQYYGDIQVEWDPEFHSPDNTNEGMQLWMDSKKSGTMTVREFTTYTLVFLENKTHESVKTDFTLTTY